ncbi:zinc finger BED domain-containing protein RICESLEEPER 2-like [Rhizophagus clarus]|uniref:Zinc finger BED domain-containing protein RICESLEEPER 2-like n=1 Tax=Rhizophagus clarus TaxID=94130 RepID=A0A8H3M4H8_9GLOM|nr:zinc finger BED domain-containing protein RICESLEEPER 2-like [Rhizophagus clarus]
MGFYEIIDTDTSKSSSSSKQRYSKVKDFADKSITTLWRYIQEVHPTICEGKEEKVSGQNSDNNTFTQQGFRKNLLRWIVTSDQPFIVVESQEFYEMILCLNPTANIPSADTLRRNLNANFEYIKGTVQRTLQEASVHWIDKEWNLKYSTLDFCLLSGPHSGENLANKFFDILQDFNIATKFLAISCDNTANMNVMLKKLSILLLEKNINFDLKLMLERALKLKKALYNAALTDKDLAKYKLADNE